jgi:predicted transglutaminase-like cysteine proteinase
MPDNFSLNDLHHKVMGLTTYITDMQQYGVEDYWVDLSDKIERNEQLIGDCEDIALTEAHLLLKAGFDPSKVQIVYCIVETGEAHVVCAVTQGETTFVLDCRSENVWPIDQYNYQWVKSMRMNEIGSWREASVAS